jgi:adenosylcobinamide kinase/adenosylcobinamide-phosphate guanylyltransferase
MGRKILLLGGARSGKSHYAQELARKLPQPVLFVATAQPGDEEMRQRIEEHRKARPPSWTTLEVAGRLGWHIRESLGSARTVLIDCITLLVGNICSAHTGPDGEPTDIRRIEPEVDAEVNGLVNCLQQVEASFIIVSNEVGLGIVPDNEMGRLYRDLLGKANQTLARNVDELYLMVAGIPCRIRPGTDFS